MSGLPGNIDAAMLTDPGLKRSRNEDSAVIRNPTPNTGEVALGALFMVADGMGGLGGGDVASQAAIFEVTRRYYLLDADDHDVFARLQAAIESANSYVRSQAAQTGLATIGSTAAGLVITPGDDLIAFNVGDCRVYRVRGGFIEQLTRDQSAMANSIDSGSVSEEEAKSARDSKVTSFLGQPIEIRPIYHRSRTQPGDLYIVCSDGLWDLVEPNEIVRIVKSGSPKSSTQKLIQKAKERGAHDNVTAIVVQIGGGRSSRGVLMGLAAVLVLAVVAGLAFLLLQTPDSGTGTATEVLTQPPGATAPPTTQDATSLALAASTSEVTSGAETATEPGIVVIVNNETATFTPSPSPSQTSTVTPSATLTATTTSTSTEAPTDAPSATPSQTATHTATEAPSATPTPTKTATRTPSPTRPPTETPAVSATNTPDVNALRLFIAQTLTEAAVENGTGTASPQATVLPTRTLSAETTPEASEEAATPEVTDEALIATLAPGQRIEAIVVAPDGVFVRSGPDRNFSSRTSISIRSRVTALAASEDNLWWFVQTVDGTQGWVYAEYLVLVDEAQIVPTVTVTPTPEPTESPTLTSTVTPLPTSTPTPTRTPNVTATLAPSPAPIEFQDDFELGISPDWSNLDELEAQIDEDDNRYLELNAGQSISVPVAHPSFTLSLRLREQADGQLDIVLVEEADEQYRVSVSASTGIITLYEQTDLVNGEQLLTNTPAAPLDAESTSQVWREIEIAFSPDEILITVDGKPVRFPNPGELINDVRLEVSEGETQPVAVDDVVIRASGELTPLETPISTIPVRRSPAATPILFPTLPSGSPG